MSELALYIRDLYKSYGMPNGRKLVVLQELCFEVSYGEFVAIVGPSGSGKTTLLHIVGGLDDYDSGEVIVDGMNLAQFSEDKLSWYRNYKVGFVFQHHNLLPEFSAIENAIMPLIIRRVPYTRAKRMAMELFEFVGLSDRINHKPGELSGGERQRVAVIRAIIGKPTILLADEPTGELDMQNSERLMELFRKIVKEYRQTIIMVTHNYEIAKKTDRMLELKMGKLTNYTFLDTNKER